MVSKNRKYSLFSNLMSKAKTVFISLVVERRIKKNLFNENVTKNVSHQPEQSGMCLYQQMSD
ncbi:CLUMA_CG014656, isoform A [Clunio marinus]|uniref:CLUMA_CG014656, isoform A n=1 Tax=Clunio marinus TaxID=568069 RepID=A0A1J1IM07_9DIPT|nr:CLUMA_CG014656, isoform A [Clunio marinus]